MLKKKEIKNCILFIVLLMLMAVFAIFIFVRYGNQHEIFTDVVYGFVSSFDSNKSIEMKLIYYLSFGGLIFIVAVHFIQLLMEHKNNADAKTDFLSSDENSRRITEFLCVLGTIFITFLILQEHVISNLIPAFVLGISLIFIDRKSAIPATSLYFTTIYSLYGVYRTIALFIYWPNISETLIILISTIIAAAPIIMKDRFKVYCRGILLSGLFVPLIFSTLLTNKYVQGEDVITLNASPRIWFFCVLLMGLCMLAGIKKIKCEWSNPMFSNTVSVGTCISIASANSLYGTGLVMWGYDLHHPFEDIFGYFQIVDAGQIPFKNYIPVSGMYSIIQGLFYDVVGGGKFANYYVTTSLFYSCVIALVMYLLSRQISSDRMFLLSLLYYMVWYNRLIFILPIMLLLIDEKIIKDKEKWLFLWFVTSLFNGLYYPLYGAAVCVGFIPLGIYQMVMIIKNKEYKEKIKTKRVKMYIAICAILLIVNSYFLLGTLKHMLSMSGQSIYADGIARFGCEFQGHSYLPAAANVIVWYLISFLLPACLVWLAGIVAIIVAKFEVRNGKIIVGEWTRFLSAISSIFVLVVSFSYTFVRMDVDGAYNRTQGVINAVGIVLIVLITKWVDNSNIRYYLICGITVIMVAGGYAGINFMHKGVSFYDVPEDFVYVSKDDYVDKLGEGFYKKAYYEEIVDAKKFFDKYGVDNQGFCGDLDFGHFYFWGAKGDSVANLTTMKGYDASREVAQVVTDNSTVMTPLDPFYYYYIYNWMMTSGEMLYDSENNAFVVNHETNKKDISKLSNRSYKSPQNMALGNTPGAWGNSLESLQPIFVDEITDISVVDNGAYTQLSFNEIEDGAEADFLYLEFAEMNKSYEFNVHNYIYRWMVEGRFIEKLVNKDFNPGVFVRISWLDENLCECSVNCEMNNGKLLIPLGSGTDWLLYPHDSLNVSLFTSSGELDYVPELQSVKLLKLRTLSCVK